MNKFSVRWFLRIKIDIAVKEDEGSEEEVVVQIPTLYSEMHEITFWR